MSPSYSFTSHTLVLHDCKMLAVCSAADASKLFACTIHRHQAETEITDFFLSHDFKNQSVQIQPPVITKVHTSVKLSPQRAIHSSPPVPATINALLGLTLLKHTFERQQPHHPASALYLALKLSLYIPGAVTSGICFSVLISSSDRPVAAFKTLEGMRMKLFQIVCVPGSETPKLAKNAAGSHSLLWLKCMMPALHRL